MRRAARAQVIAALVVALVAIAAYWYAALPRATYRAYPLTGIQYLPPPPGAVGLGELQFRLAGPVAAPAGWWCRATVSAMPPPPSTPPEPCATRAPRWTW